MPYSIGLGYGTNSARALVVDCKGGSECNPAVADHPSEHQRILLNSADYNLALEKATLEALAQARRTDSVVHLTKAEADRLARH